MSKRAETQRLLAELEQRGYGRPTRGRQTIADLCAQLEAEAPELLDPEVPCGPTRGKNRYTKAELQALAQEAGIAPSRVPSRAVVRVPAYVKMPRKLASLRATDEQLEAIIHGEKPPPTQRQELGELQQLSRRLAGKLIS